MGKRIDFVVGSVLFAPKLALEDTLRYFDLPISKHGIGRNDRGQSIMDVWEESAPDTYVYDFAEKEKSRPLRPKEFVVPAEGY